MPLLLAPRADAAPLAVELHGVVPERISGLAAAEVARLPVLADGRERPLGDCLTVSGSAADGAIECRGDFSRVHFVGAGMTAGRIRVRGPVGRHAGARMAGGTLVVDGDAGDWLAAQMAGGEVLVEGDAGDNAAAARPGDAVGMSGGIVVIAGDAGDLAGARMRRGLLAIGGDSGTAAGFEMRAGTVVVGGRAGPQAGLGMRRGTIIALGAAPEPPATFTRGALWAPPFLSLLFRRLARAGFTPTAGSLAREPWRQWHGDHLAGGRGELLHRE